MIRDVANEDNKEKTLKSCLKDWIVSDSRNLLAFFYKKVSSA